MRNAEKRKAKKQTCSWNPHHGDQYGCHYFPECRVKGRTGRWLARQVRLHFGGEKQHHLPEIRLAKHGCFLRRILFRYQDGMPNFLASLRQHLNF